MIKQKSTAHLVSDEASPTGALGVLRPALPTALTLGERAPCLAGSELTRMHTLRH